MEDERPPGRGTFGRIWRLVDAQIPTSLLEADRDEVRRARLLVLLPVVLALGAAAGGAVQAWMGRLPSVWIPVFAVSLGIGATQLLRLTRSVPIAGHAQMLALVVAMSTATISSGGLGSARLFSLSIVPMVGALLLGWKAAFLWTLPVLAEIALLLGMLRAGIDLAPEQSLAELQRAHGLAAVVIVVLTLLVVVFYERIRHRAVDELRVERDRADRATRVKSEFLANMSHEIRTPLNGVIGMLDALAAGPLGPEQEEQVAVARDSSEHLLSLLNDILDLSKVEAGRMELRTAPLDLVRLLDVVAAGHAAAASAKGIDLEVAIEDGAPRWVVSDLTRLHQVLTNLVHNAVKFTSRGRVVLRVSPGAPAATAGRVRFSVEDTGRGIDPADARRLFEPFEQATPATAVESGGTGLGLAISHRIVELLGGRLALESEAGRGSAFSFEIELPLAAPEHAGDAGIVAPSAAASRRAVAPVLVVDDSRANRLVMRAVLKQLGFASLDVGSGEEAVERVAAMGGELSVVLMDLRMPGMDGQDAARRIRALERERGLAPVPILALTASSLPEERERALAAGMDGLLVKPIRAAELEPAIDAVLGRD